MRLYQVIKKILLLKNKFFARFMQYSGIKVLNKNEKVVSVDFHGTKILVPKNHVYAKSNISKFYIEYFKYYL